jgi:hypothetical protein
MTTTFVRKHSAVAIVAAIVLLVASRVGSASVFYSTNLVTDELVLINSATGDVTTVGPLGFNALDVDLVTIGDRLFALNSNFEVRVDLHEIDPMTGASISSAQVHTAGGNVLLAEGLGQVNGQLKIGFRVDPVPFTSRSNAFGDLASSGLVTNIEANPPSLPNADFDGLGSDESGGQLYGHDGNVFQLPNDTRYFRIFESPLMIDVFYSNMMVPLPNIDDITVLGGVLFAIGDAASGRLFMLDLSTEAFSSVEIDPGEFSGLAIASQVPELSSALVWLVLMGCGAVRGNPNCASEDRSRQR